jgi:hypothetical protein
MVRRLLRPLMTTRAGSPRRLHPARSGGNSRSAVSSATHPSPPAANTAAAAITAPVFGVLGIGPAQNVLGPLPAVAKTVQRAADGPLPDHAAGLGQLPTEQRHRPAGGLVAVGLGVGDQQRGQSRLPGRAQLDLAPAVVPSPRSSTAR